MPSLSRAVLGVAVLLAGVPGAAAGAASGPRQLLPNLVALPTNAVYVGGPASYATNPSGDAVVGCQPSEVANDTPTPQRCLRFETHAANTGRGALEMHYRADQLATTRGVVQRVYAADGTYRDADAGTYVLDPTHGHFHYTDFAVASLWRSDAKGRRLDRAPVRSGSKAGFCLEDVYPYRQGGTATYTAPRACYPTNVTTSGEVSQVNGVSPGWVDVYDMSIPHQYIEISGVADGYYLLRIAIDPEHRLREQTSADNAVWQRIRLCGDRADLVGRTFTCAGGAPPGGLAQAFAATQRDTSAFAAGNACRLAGRE
jgi:hypothetical protein